MKLNETKRKHDSQKETLIYGALQSVRDVWNSLHDKWVNNKIIFSNLITNKVTYCITVFADAIYKYINEYNQTNQSENILYVSKI